MKEQGESPFTRKLPKDLSPWEKRYDDLMPKYTGTSSQWYQEIDYHKMVLVIRLF